MERGNALRRFVQAGAVAAGLGVLGYYAVLGPLRAAGSYEEETASIVVGCVGFLAAFVGLLFAPRVQGFHWGLGALCGFAGAAATAFLMYLSPEPDATVLPWVFPAWFVAGGLIGKPLPSQRGEEHRLYGGVQGTG